MYILEALQWVRDLSKFGKLGYHNDVCHAILRQVFALFLGAFVVGFECSLFTVNVIKCNFMTYLCGTPNKH